MQRDRLKTISFASALSLLCRLALAATEVEPQAAASSFAPTTGTHPVLCSISQGLFMAVIIGIGGAILMAFRKPPSQW
jgi:hypothetical protein